MFYIKSGDLYFTGDFDRSFPPDPYLGTLDEALRFTSREDAEHWTERCGGVIIEGKDVPEVDFWKGENHKSREQLREIANLAIFDYDIMPEDGRKKFFELIKEIAWRY
jgi:hypothetical protein